MMGLNKSILIKGAHGVRWRRWSKRQFRRDVHVAGTLACVFIDNETHTNGVHWIEPRPGVRLVDTIIVCFIVNEHTTKCFVWKAFSWHHSLVSFLMNTQPSVPAFVTHACLKCSKYIIHVIKYVSVFILKLGINYAVCIMWIDETWLKKLLLLVPNCYEVVAMVATSGRYGCAIVM